MPMLTRGFRTPLMFFCYIVIGMWIGLLAKIGSWPTVTVATKLRNPTRGAARNELNVDDLIIIARPYLALTYAHTLRSKTPIRIDRHRTQIIMKRQVIKPRVAWARFRNVTKLQILHPNQRR
jgi:hypothetical protein